MRKLAIFSVLLMAVGTVFTGAYAGCNSKELGTLTIKKSNEYLYQSQSMYNANQAFECGDSKNGCSSQTIKFMKGDPAHYWGNKSKSENKLYFCNTSGGAAWTEYNVTDLTECENVQCQMTNSAQKIDGWYVMDKRDGVDGTSMQTGSQLLAESRTEICRCKTIGQTIVPAPPAPNPTPNQDMADCVAAMLTSGAAWNGTSCTCTVANTKWDGTAKQCVCDDNTKKIDMSKRQCVAGATPPGGGGTGSSALQKCLNSRSTAEGKACCYVSSSIATWSGNACICKDGSKKFDVSSRQCVSTSPVVVVPGQTYNCSAATSIWVREMQVKYNSDPQISALTKQIIVFCTNDSNRSQMQLDNMITELQILIQKYDDADAKKQEDAEKKRLAEEAEKARLKAASITTSTNNIKTSFSNITAMQQGFDVSVWKTSEGKFNTSRLVSDSVAGVVLGTAGGLITSNVIKKNQVKGGFEDISCTVGGQVVADWGDEFSVGIR